jgi:hypothetical protein
MKEKHKIMRKIKKGRLAGLISVLTAILLCWTAGSYAASICPLNIPADPVTMKAEVNELKSCDVLPTLLPPDYAYFNATFSNVPIGYSIANGIYPGYCADLTGSILDNTVNGVSYQTKFWSSLDPNLPTLLKELTYTDENNNSITDTIPWDKINYVINKYPNESWLNLQPVIWSLVHGCNQQTSPPFFMCSPLMTAPYYFPFGTTNVTGSGPFGCPNSNPPVVDLSNVATIVNDANTNGSGFQPVSGQQVAMVIQPTLCTPAGICNRHLPIQVIFISVTCPNACIDIKKQISVDNGLTWYDADTVDDAPPVVPAPHGALYQLIVSNCGDVPLTEVVINDDKHGIINVGDGNLAVAGAVGASQTVTYEVATACDAEGAFENTATVSGKAYGTPITASNSAFLLCNKKQETHPSLSISKTCSGSCSSYTYTRRVKTSCNTGCSYTFSATVKNTGDETINNITCQDNPNVPLNYSFNNSNSSNPPSSLAPGDSFTVTGKTTSSADTLTCSGTGAVSSTPVSNSGSATCSLSNARPAIDVKKYVSTDGRNWSDANYPPGIMVPLCSDNTSCWSHTRKAVDNSTVHTSCSGNTGSYSNCGKVYFKFVAKNTGNTALTNISLTDSVYPLSNCTVPNTLNPYGSFSCVIGPISAEAGQHKDTATASGYYNGTKYQDTDNAFYYGYSRTTCR